MDKPAKERPTNVFALQNKGKIFQDIATCKASVTNNGAIIWELLMGMLGRGFLLSSANANCL